MPPLSRLGRQMQEVLAGLDRIGAATALIGGLAALAPHKVIRATQDIEDIRALLRANRDDVNLVDVREYFRLFDREALLETSSRNSIDGAASTRPPIALAAAGGAPATATVGSRDPYEALDDLMAVVEALCPSWPERSVFGPMRDLRL